MSKNQLINLKTISKLALVAFMFAGVQVNEAYAQEEVKEKKEKKVKEKKVKEEKDSGKITKSDKNSDIVKYRRSSLHTMIIEDAKLPRIDLILKTFNAAPVPDKYNDHTIESKLITIAGPDTSAAALIAESEKSKKEKKAEGKDMSPEITQFFADNKVANKMMAKWFNRSPEGGFNMNLIGERGLYDASAQDAAVANSTERGAAMLADAGEDLIGNSFVVVHHTKFVSNEVAAKAALTIATALASKMPGALQKGAQSVAQKAYEKARQGYSVKTTAYLYQLQFTDSIAAVFYQNMWMDDSSIDAVKKEMFDKTDLFQLKLLGFQKAKALVTGLSKDSQGEEAIVQKATIKSIDAVYGKLQRKFEAFRTKTPMVSADPIGAKIGLKEGVEKGDKYEVLEKQIDADGKVKWKRKGTVTVDKKNIWDNVSEEGDLDEDGNLIKKQDIKFTHFKGKGKYYPGMLLRQIN
tara:strand:+ start:616 stop:2010 length:1395 start_codon:yes stop_codon:yes gene_type:complete